MKYYGFKKLSINKLIIKNISIKEVIGKQEKIKDKVS
jgi:hypothetical protein